MLLLKRGDDDEVEVMEQRTPEVRLVVRREIDTLLR
jgi:hypothetical protein